MGEVAHVGHARIDGELAPPGFVAERITFVDCGKIGSAGGNVVLGPLGAEGEDDLLFAFRSVILNLEPSAASFPVERVVF